MEQLTYQPHEMARKFWARKIAALAPDRRGGRRSHRHLPVEHVQAHPPGRREVREGRAAAPRDPGGAGGLRPAAERSARSGGLMARHKRAARANLRSSIYRGDDGYWHGRVTMGVRDDGTPDRRHVMSKDKAKVTAKVRQLERQRDDGVVIKPGRAWTVERWLTHWLENIAKPSVRYKPYIGYRTAVNRHLIPGPRRPSDRPHPARAFREAVRPDAGKRAQARHSAPGAPDRAYCVRRGFQARLHCPQSGGPRQAAPGRRLGSRPLRSRRDSNAS